MLESVTDKPGVVWLDRVNVHWLDRVNVHCHVLISAKQMELLTQTKILPCYDRHEHTEMHQYCINNWIWFYIPGITHKIQNCFIIRSWIQCWSCLFALLLFLFYMFVCCVLGFKQEHVPGVNLICCMRI